jgi:hypothetical protein
MKTLALLMAYMVTVCIIFVVPAILIAILFPCSYYDVVTFPFYTAFMSIMALIAAVPVCQELEEKY